MLNMAVRNTNKLIREVSRTDNIRMGRFFTKKAEARHMASLISPPDAEECTLLDAGAGTGILAIAAIERLCLAAKSLRIAVTCYENDPIMLPMLRDNMERIRKRCRRLYGVKLLVTVKDEDFMASGDENVYDIVIMNPPSRPIEPQAAEALAFSKLYRKETDICYLFALKAFAQLKDQGQAIFLLPSAFACGVYIEPMRRFLLDNAALTHILLADNGRRAPELLGKAAASAPPFAKHMACRLVKSEAQGEITLITVAPNGEGTPFAPFAPHFILRGEEKNILLLRNRDEEEVVRFVESQTETLSSLGLRMRTGLTLASRYADCLRAKSGADTVPLIRPRGLAGGRVTFPLNDGRDYLVPRLPSLRQKNKNLLLIKRVPTKKDGRHIVAAVYYASQFPRVPYISTDNKLNFIDYADDREMSVPLVTGLYALFSSSLYDRYLTIISDVRRVNSSLYDTLPLPSEKMLIEIGRQLTLLRGMNERTIDATVTAVFRKYSRLS